MSKRFYVYVHKYASGPKQGQVFYVGKGTRDRCSKKTSRNEYWTNTVNKYGYYWEIVKRFNNHHCALTYEKIVINTLRMANLVNLTSGGDGSHGFKPPWSKVVTCSNGMVFESAKAASRWANNGRGRQSIVDCCNGKQPAALGYSWGWGYSPVVYRRPRVNKGCIVYCSNGMEFKSIADAVRFLKNNGHPRASGSKVSAACLGNRKSAYGLTWSINKDFIPENRNFHSEAVKKSLSKRILCIDEGVVFESLQEASKWLREVKNKKQASHGSLSVAARGINKTAYGYKWRYIKEDETNTKALPTGGA